MLTRGSLGVELIIQDNIEAQKRKAKADIDTYKRKKPTGWEQLIAQQKRKVALLDAMLKMFGENDSPHMKEWELELLIANDKWELGELDLVAQGFPGAASKAPGRDREELMDGIRELEAKLNALTQAGMRAPGK